MGSANKRRLQITLWSVAVLLYVFSLTLLCVESGSWRISVTTAGNVPAGAALKVGERVDAVMRETTARLGFEPYGPYRVILAGDGESFNREAGPGVPEWAVAIYSKRRIVVRPEGLAGNAEGFFGILSHEFAHAALDHKFHDSPDSLPRWLNEGLAMAVSGAWEIPEDWEKRKTSLYVALREGRALDFEDLSEGFPSEQLLAQIAYAQSADFTRRLLAMRGWKGIRRFLDRLAEGVEFDIAFQKEYGRPFERAVSEWRDSIGGNGLLITIMHVFANFDLYLWVGIVLLLIAGFVVLRFRKRRPSISGEYDPSEDDEDDDLADEWSDEDYGYRPWHPRR